MIHRSLSFCCFQYVQFAVVFDALSIDEIHTCCIEKHSLKREGKQRKNNDKSKMYIERGDVHRTSGIAHHRYHAQEKILRIRKRNHTATELIARLLFSVPIIITFVTLSFILILIVSISITVAQHISAGKRSR